MLPAVSPLIGIQFQIRIQNFKRIIQFPIRIPHLATKETSALGLASTRQIATIESNYILEITNLLNRNKHYPREAVVRELEGVVTVSVTINREGQVTESKLETVSAFALLNNAALATVSKIGDLPAPPDALFENRGKFGSPGFLRLRIPILFHIDRHQH